VSAQEIYSKYGLDPTHFARLGAETITTLTSYKAGEMYKQHKIKPDQLKDIIHNIQDGTSFDQIAEMVIEKTEASSIVFSLEYHSTEQGETPILGDHHTDGLE
jgi:hypothetical protein